MRTAVTVSPSLSFPPSSHSYRCPECRHVGTVLSLEQLPINGPLLRRIEWRNATSKVYGDGSSRTDSDSVAPFFSRARAVTLVRRMFWFFLSGFIGLVFTGFSGGAIGMGGMLLLPKAYSDKWMALAAKTYRTATMIAVRKISWSGVLKWPASLWMSIVFSYLLFILCTHASYRRFAFGSSAPYWSSFLRCCVAYAVAFLLHEIYETAVAYCSLLFFPKILLIHVANYLVVQYAFALSQPTSAVAPLFSKCSECDSGAPHYCTDCDADFCEVHCKQVHAFAAMKNHCILGVSEKAAVKANKPPQCDQHQSPMLLYCQQCNTLCCSVCHLHGVHNNHTAARAEDQANTMREELVAAGKESERIQSELDREAKQLLQAETKVADDEASTLQRVHKACTELRRRIDEQEQRLVAEITSTAASAREEIRMRLTSVALAQSQVSFAVEGATRVSALPTYPLLSSASGGLKERANAVDQVRSLQQTNSTNDRFEVPSAESITDLAALTAMKVTARADDFAQEGSTSASPSASASATA